MSVIGLKQININQAITIGKVTAGLLAHKIAQLHFGGSNRPQDVAELQMIWGWINALKEQRELNETGTIEYITYTVTVEPEIGEEYNGGYVFYKSGGTALICAIPSDLDSTNAPKLLKWVPDAFANTVIVNTFSYIGSGEANTTAIVSTVGAGTYPAKKCSDLSLNSYTDWYLPSRHEMMALMQQKNVIGGLKKAYWTSTASTESSFGSTNLPAFAYIIFDDVTNNMIRAELQIKSQNRFNNPTFQISSGNIINDYHDLYFHPIRKDTYSASATTSSVTTVTNNSLKVEDWMNYNTETQAKLVMEKLFAMGRKHLPPLIFKKYLENDITLI